MSLLETIDAAGSTGEAQLALSDSGSLIYLPSNVEPGKLVWVDRSGTRVGDVGAGGLGVQHPSLSPDERFVVYSAGRDADRQVFSYDMKTTTTTRLSVSATDDDRPVWSPDGAWVAFNTNVTRSRVQVTSSREIVARQSDAGGPIETIVSSPGPDWLGDWWKGATEYLLFDRETGEGGLWYRRRTAPSGAWEAPQKFRDGPGVVVPKLSPNGRYVAYLTRFPLEVEVTPFPSGGRRWKISNNGGHRIRWSRDGTELFYVHGQDLMSVRVSMTGDLNPSRPSRLFSWPGLAAGTLDNPSFDLSRDGRRFLVIDTPVTRRSINVVLHWKEELKRLVSAQ